MVWGLALCILGQGLAEILAKGRLVSKERGGYDE